MLSLVHPLYLVWTNSAWFTGARKCCSEGHMIGLLIIIAEMAVFNVAGYLIEERRRWPVITASPRGQKSK